jgi:hypothetical protein
MAASAAPPAEHPAKITSAEPFEFDTGEAWSIQTQGLVLIGVAI